jgi:hypothetical protein
VESNCFRRFGECAELHDETAPGMRGRRVSAFHLLVSWVDCCDRFICQLAFETSRHRRYCDTVDTACNRSTMTQPSNAAITSSLLSALLSLRATPPRIIQSPPTQPRRASVALIIRYVHMLTQCFYAKPFNFDCRLKPPTGLNIPANESGVGLSIEEFFRLRTSIIPHS